MNVMQKRLVLIVPGRADAEMEPIATMLLGNVFVQMAGLETRVPILVQLVHSVQTVRMFAGVKMMESVVIWMDLVDVGAGGKARFVIRNVMMVSLG